MYRGTSRQKKKLKSNEIEQFHPSFYFCGVTVEDMSDLYMRSGEIEIFVDCISLDFAISCFLLYPVELNCNIGIADNDLILFRCWMNSF